MAWWRRRGSAPAEYKQAFVETGGEEDAFIPLEIYVDYRLHCNDGKIVSFVISKAETQASYYEELFFYNIDLQTGRDLTLRDLLGPDYREIVDQSVRRAIDERMAEERPAVLFSAGGRRLPFHPGGSGLLRQ